MKLPSGSMYPNSIWDFPKIRVPYFGVLIIRILLFRVLYFRKPPYTLALKVPMYRDYFKAKSTIWAHGSLGAVVLQSFGRGLRGYLLLV